jgi:hypothetical protein
MRGSQIIAAPPLRLQRGLQARLCGKGGAHQGMSKQCRSTDRASRTHAPLSGQPAAAGRRACLPAA